MRILLVDDEPPLLKMISMYLGRMGYTVHTAKTTDGAWAEVGGAAGEFSAAVLDATMDGLSAENLALKLLAANPSLCVIIASGYPVTMTVLEAAGPGRVMFLPKPFTSEMLATALRRMIAAQEEAL